MGVLVALERADPAKPLHIVTDSQYVLDGLVGRNGKRPWHEAWQRNSWRTSKREPVANRGLWERLIAISKKRRFRMSWQRGHSGHAGNEMADKMARNAASLAKQFKKH